MNNVSSFTDAAVTAVAHPMTVQVVNQGPGIWGNVVTGLITGLLTGGITLAGIWLTHRFTLKREKLAAADKLGKERYFISTELVFLLERFAQACVEPALEVSNLDEEGHIITLHDFPLFDYSTVTGDWRALPDELIYKLSEFPIKHEEARRSVSLAEKTIASANDIFYGELQTQCSHLGVSAINLSRELRKLCGMPEDDLSKYTWSAWKVLDGIYQSCQRNFVRDMYKKRRPDDQTSDSSVLGDGSS
ncbi:hypothetical protein [Duffyella gerundensis]|uniref:hypothetical protein n=1 Tax=Duffyella gerundensis TaxID=1619313 RepID=UPI003FD522CC